MDVHCCNCHRGFFPPDDCECIGPIGPTKGDARTVDLLASAREVVQASPLFKRFIEGTPLSNDIACWMVEFVINDRANRDMPYAVELVEAQQSALDAALQRQEAQDAEIARLTQTCKTCRFTTTPYIDTIAGNEPEYLARVQGCRFYSANVPLTVNNQPFGCAGHQPLAPPTTETP